MLAVSSRHGGGDGEHAVSDDRLRERPIVEVSG
jgi:hypothetical protein